MSVKVNKNQALYRYLPGAWATYSTEKGLRFACKIAKWNTKDITGINEDMIRSDILRRVRSFRKAGGDTTSEFSDENILRFKFVQPVMNEGIPDIYCEMDPCTFYCEKCRRVEYRPNSNELPKCRHNYGEVLMKQLQMVYACECGFAEGVKPKSNRDLIYKFDSPSKNDQYKFYDKNNNIEEMEKICPICKNKLKPKNALDHGIFYSQTGSMVNLYNEDYSRLLKRYKSNAEILMLAKQFDIIDHEQFLDIVTKPDKYFNSNGLDINSEFVQEAAKQFQQSPESILQFINSVQHNDLNINTIRDKIEERMLINSLGSKLDLINSNLIEYDVLKYPQSKISLDEAIENCKNIGQIVDEHDILNLINKMNIKSMQVSEMVYIVNYAFGYTRVKNCPDGESEHPLRLNGFQGKVFTNLLETEGILVEVDMAKIYKWLVDNKIIEDDIEFEDDVDLKQWFIENINLESISHFSEITHKCGNMVTKVVYSLLHTMSHMMIFSAGKHSGLSKDSLSEIIFPNTCSFFIYPTANEGVTLGSISGMFENKIKLFLEDALYENEICTFDPICSTTQNGACVACTYLSDVSCVHFNKDLSRSYLYGGTIKLGENEEIVIKKGFWK